MKKKLPKDLFEEAKQSTTDYVAERLARIKLDVKSQKRQQLEAAIKSGKPMFPPDEVLEP